MQYGMRSGKVILEAAILTAVVVISLTAYTFWAAKRGHDFEFLGPFLFAALMVLMVFSLIQVGCLYLVSPKYCIFIMPFFLWVFFGSSNYLFVYTYLCMILMELLLHRSFSHWARSL